MKNTTKRNIKRKQLVKRQDNISRFPSSVIRYHDYYLTDNSTGTVGLVDTLLISQGAGQSQRIADTIYLVAMDVTMVLITATSDVTSQVRWSLFNWLPNTASLVPGAASYYESPATYGTLTPLNFEGRQDFTTIVDQHSVLAGLSSAPTALSIKKYSKRIPITSRITYNLSVNTGYNHIFFANFSDSLVTPHPTYQLMIRYWYTQ